jgi:Co/Zn/Cd efflux system component
MTEQPESQQRKVLSTLLAINFIMFLIEVFASLLADSTALFADSLDMLADALVYGVSLYAIGQSLLHKARVAFVSGVVELLMGLAALFEVTTKWLYGSAPESDLMMAIGFLALIANIICVYLIAAFRHGDIHLRASYIFSKNDVIANLGVISSGALVAWLDSNLPDLIIGLVIAFVIISGGIKILRESWTQLNCG